MIDRTEVNRALAKAIAFKQCGKQHDAEMWARRLVELLECHEILDPDHGWVPASRVHQIGDLR